jgi:hypothetical protein
MRARVGDWIVVRGRTFGALGREGRIDELLHADGSPAAAGALLDDDRRSVLFPGPEAVVTAGRPHATGQAPARRP